MRRAQLKPVFGNIYRIEYNNSDEGLVCDFGEALAASQGLEEEGQIGEACNVRFASFQSLMELIPDSTDMELDWEDNDSRDALLLISFSAIDHFLVGDFEMSAAMLEMLLELDPEDHLEASKVLAYVYVAMKEYESFDEVIDDVSDKQADKQILLMWSEFRKTGNIPSGVLRYFKQKFKPYYEEFTAVDHPVDEAYLKDINSDRPTHKALAREMWLQTEHLWTMFPGFIEALSREGA